MIKRTENITNQINYLHKNIEGNTVQPDLNMHWKHYFNLYYLFYMWEVNMSTPICECSCLLHVSSMGETQATKHVYPWCFSDSQHTFSWRSKTTHWMCNNLPTLFLSFFFSPSKGRPHIVHECPATHSINQSEVVAILSCHCFKGEELKQAYAISLS